MEFNPDGSIKVPDRMARNLEQQKHKMKKSKCMMVRRDIVNDRSPKKCMLHIRLSEAIKDKQFVENIYKFWKETAQVPSKIQLHDDGQYTIEIGTDFKRCTDCNALIGRYREHLYGNLIEKRGNCTFEGFKRNFSYEDYFD